MSLYEGSVPGKTTAQKGETHLERLNSTRDIEIVGEPRGTFQTKADMEGGNAVAIGISKKSK